MKQKTIAVINQKGGVGKTTTTISLAACFGAKGKKVLVIDADPQGNATSGLGMDKTKLSSTLCDVLVSGQDMSVAVQPTSAENVFIVPTDARLASAEIDLANVAERESVLKTAMKGTDYDYVLIDCPPALSLLTINALVAADYVLIPVQGEYYALEGLSQLLQVMQTVQKNNNPELELLGVVLTMFDKRNNLAQQVKTELTSHFGDKLVPVTIPRNVRLAEAPSHGLPINEYDRWSKGARAYKNFAQDIDKRINKRG